MAHMIYDVYPLIREAGQRPAGRGVIRQDPESDPRVTPIKQAICVQVIIPKANERSEAQRNEA